MAMEEIGQLDRIISYLYALFGAALYLEREYGICNKYISDNISFIIEMLEEEIEPDKTVKPPVNTTS